MRYHDVDPIDRTEAERALASEDPQRINHALLSLALHDPDWRWVQERILVFLGHRDPEVRGLAATCLGHLARIHGQIDERAVAALLALRGDPLVRARAEDALEDISQFAG